MVNTGNSLVTRPDLPYLVVQMLQLASNAHWEVLRLTNSHHALQSLLISAGHLSKVSNLLDVWLAFLVSSRCLIKMFTWMKSKASNSSLFEVWRNFAKAKFRTAGPILAARNLLATLAYTNDDTRSLLPDSGSDLFLDKHLKMESTTRIAFFRLAIQGMLKPSKWSN